MLSGSQRYAVGLNDMVLACSEGFRFAPWSCINHAILTMNVMSYAVSQGTAESKGAWLVSPPDADQRKERGNKSNFCIEYELGCRKSPKLQAGFQGAQGADTDGMNGRSTQKAYFAKGRTGHEHAENINCM
jgi:hypothetical protein